MSARDLQGRAYATVAGTRAGDRVLVDGDFTCLKPWSEHVVDQDSAGLFVRCADGHHYLDGQVQGGVYLGIYHAKTGGDQS